MDNPRRNIIMLCIESCWDPWLGKTRHWQWGQRASCHLARTCCCTLESIIALHILSEQTNPAFGTPNQQICNNDGREQKKWIRTKWILSCRPALRSSLVTLVETETADGIDEDDPDLAIYFMTMKCTVRTPCISVHHSFIALCVFLLLSYWDPLCKVSFSFVWISIRHMFNPIAYVQCLYFSQWYWFFWWY